MTPIMEFMDDDESSALQTHFRWRHFIIVFKEVKTCDFPSLTIQQECFRCMQICFRLRA